MELMHFMFNVIQSRRMREVGYIAHISKMRNLYEILVTKPDRKSSLEEFKFIWKEILKLIPDR